ncbi:hypothetical protein [Pelagicoccus sp. SDUM812003]|uniref:hypothetical protein n=1 Tax=Pelagicoccus sp. SDUM812003 TaxID=3041267 RepID=UPI00280EEE09|nr:hypothetical protein [Pelagicoccus sp. SDUM812003]MDQ8205120.1 hypothetical protein [Pelagicoccus sp. SDUM812003]
MSEKTNTLKALVGISAIIGGVSIVVVTFFAIFAPQQIAASAWIVGALCAMGSALGYLSARREG